MDLREKSLLNERFNQQNMSDIFKNLAVIEPEELIDVDQIDFGADDVWLSTPIDNMILNVREEPGDASLTDLDKSKQKKIDTRTFTRPKKKPNRPSIELYNATYNNSLLLDHDSVDHVYANPKNNSDLNGCQLEAPKFDLAQPITCDPFERILLNSSCIDSLTNMTPPTLINSMCSSYSSQMMDSINQKEHFYQMMKSNNSDIILLQDTEQPMFQSITESCSSLSSEMQDSFLKKTLSTFNSTFKPQSSKEDLHKSLINSLNKTDSSKDSSLSQRDTLNETVVVANRKASEENIDPNITFTTGNNTFTKIGNNRLDGTFNKSQQEMFNTTYQKKTLTQRFLKHNDVNATYTESNNYDTSSINHLLMDDEKQVEDSHETALDMNDSNSLQKNEKASYIISNGRVAVGDSNSHLAKISKTYDEIKDASSNDLISPGSTDSLDRISSLSNSSCRILNMTEVDALIEMQEMCLLESSTPLVRNKTARHEPYGGSSTRTSSKSESDLSSTDEYVTVGSCLSNQSSTNSLSKDPIRYDKQIKSCKNEAIAAVKAKNICNVNGTEKKSNLTSLPQKLKGSLSNIKVLDPKLRGSYTNLKPMSTNLPQISNSNTHLPGQRINNVVRVPLATANETVVKSKLKAPTTHAAGVSALPRPATGIPRPTSRIPMPGRPTSVKPPLNRPKHF